MIDNLILKENIMFYRVTIRIEKYDDSDPDVGPSFLDGVTRYERSYDNLKEAKQFSGLVEEAAEKIAEAEK